jgi:hypothetical protein
MSSAAAKSSPVAAKTLCIQRARMTPRKLSTARPSATPMAAVLISAVKQDVTDALAHEYCGRYSSTHRGNRLPGWREADFLDEGAVALVVVEEIEAAFILDVEQERGVLAVTVFQQRQGLLPLT